MKGRLNILKMSSTPEAKENFIPLAKPWFGPDTIQAIERVLDSGWVIMGREVEVMESSIARLHEAEFASAVSSATAGLHLAIIALGADLVKGAPCYIPSFAWPSAANMAVRSGFRPVFTDVELNTANMSPRLLQKTIEKEEEDNPEYKGNGLLVIIHEFGNPAPMDELMAIANKHHLKVVEDAACALGTSYKGKPVGTFGECGVFSFHPRKSITTGEGGCIITNNPDLKYSFDHLRNHGQAISEKGGKSFVSAGFNYRMTDIQATIGNGQLKAFSKILKKRYELVAQYLSNLNGVYGLVLPENQQGHSWQTFMIILEEKVSREQICKSMRLKNIGCGPASVASHSLDFFKQHFGYHNSDLPNSLTLHNKGLALPLYHDLTLNDVDYVSHSLKEVLTAG